MNDNRPTIEFDGNDHPPLITDAIGGEPVSVMATDFHVKVLTWHGVTEPYTVDNAQALYLTPRNAYTLGETLMDAADRVTFKALDRQEGGNTA